MNTCYWPLHTPSPSALVRLTNAWQGLLAHLEANAEPRVWPDTAEADHWNAYDPITQLAIDHASADELRVWLEELHYHA